MKVFILVFSILIAVATFYYGAKMIRLYSRVKKWSKIKATILKKGIADRKLASASRANHIIVAEYTYQFNGAEYNGNKVFLVELLKGERNFFYDDAQKFLNKLRSEQDIFVNPDKPEESVIFCNGIGLYALMLVLGLLSLLAGLANYIS